jgi:hypothetical protein
MVEREFLGEPCPDAGYWEQPAGDLPDWQTSYQHLVAEGQVAQLSSSSSANQTRAFPPPVEPS